MNIEFWMYICENQNIFDWTSISIKYFLMCYQLIAIFSDRENFMMLVNSPNALYFKRFSNEKKIMKYEKTYTNSWLMVIMILFIWFLLFIFNLMIDFFRCCWRTVYLTKLTSFCLSFILKVIDKNNLKLLIWEHLKNLRINIENWPTKKTTKFQQ